MSEKVYSTDNENFKYSTEHEAASDALSDDLENEGVTIYSGDTVEYNITEFFNVSVLVDNLRECSDDECGEFSEGYLNDVTQDQEKELNTVISLALNDWANKHLKQPNFYKVVNVTENYISHKTLCLADWQQ